MYGNMSDELGISACESDLNLRDLLSQDDELDITTDKILEALNLCIKNNYFEFNEKMYKVKGGVGTGVKLAPPYACLGMGKYENIVFESANDLVSLVVLWKRFIDDIFMLFKGSKEQCDSLVSWLNSLMTGVVKFTYDFSENRIEFLDLVIFKENGRLQTDLFIKPSNKQLYLDFNSNHPSHCKSGLVFGQALRIIERCTKSLDVDKHLTNLKSKLLERNYPEHLIEDQFSRAKSHNRRDLIFKPKKSTKNDSKVRLIFTYNGGGPPFHKWFREGKKLLLKNDEAKKMGDNLQIAYRQPKNLQKIVCGTKKQSVGDQVDISGCYKCNHCRVSCPILNETKTFSSTNTGKSYRIRQYINCESTNVIYLATCKKCGGQYVGKSKTKFKTRHSNHKQEIKKKYGGLGHHYGGAEGCGYENLSIILIEKIPDEKSDTLPDRETFWQHQLRVYVENGYKGHCYRKDL